MDTYTVSMLAISGIITLIAGGSALIIYLRDKLKPSNPTAYSMTCIGIVWAVLVASLFLGGAFAKSWTSWLASHVFLTVMLCASAFAISVDQALRRLSSVMLAVSCLLFVGVMHYVTNNAWLTTLWVIIAIMIYAAGTDYIDKTAKARSDHDQPQQQTVPSGSAPTHRIIWQRQPSADPAASGHNAEEEIRFQPAQYGYDDPHTPRPLEPTFKPFTEVVTPKD